MKKEEIFDSSVINLWPMLCFQAGVINAGGFLACQKFVSHITGMGTKAGLELGQNQFLMFAEIIAVPVIFILGGTFASYFIFKTNQKPASLLRLIPLVFITSALIAISCLGATGFFGQFGAEIDSTSMNILLLSLCFISGTQNGYYAAITTGMVRTTHMTGIATDIGIHLAQLITFKDKLSWLWLNLRTQKFITFMMGALFASLMFKTAGYMGFMLPAVLSLISLVWTYYGIIRVNEPYVQNSAFSKSN